MPTVRQLAAEATRGGYTVTLARRAGPDLLIVLGVALVVAGLYLMVGLGPAVFVLGVVVAVLGWMVS